MRGTQHWHTLPWEAVGSPPWWSSACTQTRAPHSRWLCWSQAGPGEPRGPFHPRPFFSSVVLLFLTQLLSHPSFVDLRSSRVERLQLCPVCKDGRVDKGHDSTACATTIVLKRLFLSKSSLPHKVALLWKGQNSHRPPKFGSHSLTLSTCSQNLMPLDHSAAGWSTANRFFSQTSYIGVHPCCKLMRRNAIINA